MQTVLQDVRYASRQLLDSRSFAIVAIMSLACSTVCIWARKAEQWPPVWWWGLGLSPALEPMQALRSE